MISLPDAYIIRNTKPNMPLPREVVLDYPGQLKSVLVASSRRLTPWVGRDFLLPAYTTEMVRATHIPGTNCFLEEL